jgi:ribosomal protein S14
LLLSKNAVSRSDLRPCQFWLVPFTEKGSIVVFDHVCRETLGQRGHLQLFRLVSRKGKRKLAHARQLIAAASRQIKPAPQEAATIPTDHPCPHCGSRMVIIETFEAGRGPRHRPSAPALI